MTSRKSTDLMTTQDAAAILDDALASLKNHARSWERRAMCEKLHCDEDEYDIFMNAFIEEAMHNCEKTVKAYNAFKALTV